MWADYLIIKCNAKMKNVIMRINALIIVSLCIVFFHASVLAQDNFLTNNNTGLNVKRTININTSQALNEKKDTLFFQDPRWMFPTGVSLLVNWLDPSFSLNGIKIDHFTSPNISLEGSISLAVLKWHEYESPNYYDYYEFYPFLSFGGKYFFARKTSESRFSPYAGFDIGVELNYYAKSIEPFVDIPVGVQFIAKSGFQISAGVKVLNPIALRIQPVLFPELAIGWRFKAKKK